MSDKTKTGLALLREPFPPNQIARLPKPTKAQTDEVRNDFKKGIRCTECGGWHHPKVVHLDYVGHAALTDRLLDADPEWNWEPVSFDDKGQPAMTGGMWIRLTVCGVTRLGYGHADGKSGGDAIKEVIGDALRNAAMRFGAALDLWHKGDLHGGGPDAPTDITPKQFIQLRDLIEEKGADQAKLLKHYGAASLEQFPISKFDAAIEALKNKQAPPPQTNNADLGDDEIPH